MVHLIGGAWNAKLHQIFIGIINQPTTVKTGARRGATPAIRLTYLPHQFVHRRFCAFCMRALCTSASFVTFAHFVLWPLRTVHFHSPGWRLCGWFCACRSGEFWFYWRRSFGLSGDFLLNCFAGGFFLRSVDFARCVFCTAECRACSEAFAAGVNESVVNSKAQSVIEILVIRATGQSPDKCRPQCIPA